MPSPSKSPARIAGMFDAIAGRYDLLNHLLSGGIDRRWRRRAIRALALSGGERVLDLCTGTADLAIAARSARPPPARVIGVDFAAAMLAVAARKLRRGGANGIALLRGDATHVPLADASVDAVTMAFGIRNVEDPVVAAGEIRRLLKPGGRFAILEFSIPAAPGLHGAYLWYFRRILPRIGRFVSRDEAAYEYLPASVGAFAAPEELVAILRTVGLTAVTAVPLTFGIVHLYTGCRAR